MEFEFLSPLNEDLLEEITSDPQRLGKQVKLHTVQHGIPDLEGVNIAIVGVRENRLDEGNDDEFLNFDGIRRSFYKLFPGNWHLNLADLGDIEKGETVEDTYYALQTLVAELLKEGVIPFILGGSQDLVYAQYRAYDNLLKW